MEPSNSLASPRHKVIIVGGGMAGLSACYHLIKNGITDFKLLEARRRVGGRIVQIDIGREKVELGANWIHGILGNPVYELAMEHGLVDIMQLPKTHKVVASTENGKQVPFGVLQEIYEAYLCFLKRCEEYFVTQYLPPDGVDSVGDHIRLEISLYLENVEDSAERQLRQLIFDCLLKRETCISGCDNMSQIDLLELGSYTELQGGNITLPQGYSSILQPLSQAVPSECVLLEHAVDKIEWDCNNSQEKCQDSGDETGNDSDDSDRTVIDEDEIRQRNSDIRQQHDSDKNENRQRDSDKTNNANVTVHCSNGVTLLADHVICTIPLGVLKQQADTIFNPVLPEEKRDAIDRLLFGTVDKILLEYDRPFLNPDVTEVLLLWNDRKDSNSNDYRTNWYKKIYSFSKISDTLLVGWISGREAEHMETLSNETVVEVCTNILRKFLNDPFIPKPKNCICTSWFTQPYTRGSYTAVAVGASQLDIECLSLPLFSSDARVTLPVLLFAGEHTHATFYSTVHGAYLSGRTAAQILLCSNNSNAASSSSIGNSVLSAQSSAEILLQYDEGDDDSDLSSWIQGICLN